MVEQVFRTLQVTSDENSRHDGQHSFATLVHERQYTSFALSSPSKSCYSADENRAEDYPAIQMEAVADESTHQISFAGFAAAVRMARDDSGEVFSHNPEGLCLNAWTAVIVGI